MLVASSSSPSPYSQVTAHGVRNGHEVMIFLLDRAFDKQISRLGGILLVKSAFLMN